MCRSFFLNNRHPTVNLSWYGRYASLQAVTVWISGILQAWKLKAGVRDEGGKLRNTFQERRGALGGVVFEWCHHKHLRPENLVTWVGSSLGLVIFASCMVALKRTCALASERDQNFKMVLKDNSRTVAMASPHLQMQLEWSSVPLNLMKSGGRWQILWLSLWQEYHAKAGHWGLVQVNSIRWELYDADTIHYKNRPPDAFYVPAPTEHSWCAAAFECYQCMLRWLLKSSAKKNALLPSSKKRARGVARDFELRLSLSMMTVCCHLSITFLAAFACWEVHIKDQQLRAAKQRIQDSLHNHFCPFGPTMDE